jgi:AP-2 complex subunit mu-1
MICKSYFRGELDEKCIRENFVLIYELLDGTSIYLEICDYGIPQITDAELLKKYI